MDGFKGYLKGLRGEFFKICDERIQSVFLPIWFRGFNQTIGEGVEAVAGMKRDGGGLGGFAALDAHDNTRRHLQAFDFPGGSAPN